MSKSWLYIMGIMLVGSYLSVYIGSAYIAVLIDLITLAASYFILRRDPWTNFKSSMTFMTILIAISILSTLGFIRHYVYTEALVALIGWTWFGLYSKIFQGFIAGCIVYNGVMLLQVFKNFAVIDLSTAAISLGALISLAYINR